MFVVWMPFCHAAKDVSELSYKLTFARSYLSRIARFSISQGSAATSRPSAKRLATNICANCQQLPRVAVISTLAHARRIAPKCFIVLALAKLMISALHFWTRIVAISAKCRGWKRSPTKRYSCKPVLATAEDRVLRSAAQAPASRQPPIAEPSFASCIGKGVTTRILPV